MLIIYPSYGTGFFLIPPGSIIKPEVFSCFEEGIKKTSGMKWVNKFKVFFEFGADGSVMEEKRSSAYEIALIT